MMTSRERVYKTLNHEPVDRAPRQVWALPGVPKYYTEAWQRFNKKYPGDIGGPALRYGVPKRARGIPSEVGEYVDEFGSVWHVGEPGVIGEVKEPAIANLDDAASYELPWELLDGADFSQANASCAASDLFILAGSLTRPFERLQFLLGTEQTLMGLAYGDERLLKLLERLHEFECRDLAMLAATDVDGLSFMDDWGSQNALLISPAMWRQVFKPMYAEYCSIIRGAGKKVFFHSDGFIEAIYPDLIEVGVDALNSQLFCMDIEKLGELYQGKLTWWGEIDRQWVLPFGTPVQAREAVRRVRRALDKGQGGVIAECEWGMDTPAENVEAVFEAWLEPRESF